MINSTIIIIGIGGVLYFHLRARRMFKLQDAIIQKYRFYKVRDELICLVGSDQIEENDFVFQFFYEATNFVIKHTQILNLDSLMRTLEEARAAGIDPPAENVVKKVLTEVASKGTETRCVVNNFYEAVLQTIVQNSLTIRLAIKHPQLLRVAARTRKFFSATISVTPAYALYRRYKEALSQTSGNGSYATA